VMLSRTISTDDSGFWTPVRQRDGLVILLTLVTGAVDAIGLTRLGGVFTSVMTGNMVLLGLAAAKENAAIAYHTGVAFVGYVIGSLIGARVAGHAHDDDQLWPRPIVFALGLELVMMLVFAIWWELVSGAPTPGEAYAMLALNAGALGVQSSAVLRFGISGLSTTYLTGTLTQLLANFTKHKNPIQGRSVLILLALIGGAAVGAVLALHVTRMAPIFPLAVLVIVVVGAEISFHRQIRH
jgi:uncharacterized membrane protein YoaK (UPF0700 family)